MIIYRQDGKVEVREIPKMEKLDRVIPIESYGKPLSQLTKEEREKMHQQEKLEAEKSLKKIDFKSIL